MTSSSDRLLAYRRAGLAAEDLASEPLAQTRAWLTTATDEGLPLPNTMQLATVDAGGRPWARSVLLKAVDDRGLVWFTNYRSRKGRELEANPHAAVVLHWSQLDRQVCAGGRVERVEPGVSDAYFATRPRGSQLSAWASAQSTPLADRATLLAAVAELDRVHAGVAVPRPPHWGGYRLVPDEVEFWQGRDDRLHDRFVYRHAAQGWRIERLAP